MTGRAGDVPRGVIDKDKRKRLNIQEGGNPRKLERHETKYLLNFFPWVELLYRLTPLDDSDQYHDNSSHQQYMD